MMQQNAPSNKYSTFIHKPPGLVTGSKEASLKEEIYLCMKLIEEFQCRNHLRLAAMSWYTFNSSVTSVLQGYRQPICGLVVLRMAGEMLRKLNPETPQFTTDELLAKAIKKGATKQGEMFSAYEMAELAETLYNCKANIIVGEMSSHISYILKQLLCGHPILVPYDNDKNFEPCLRNGHAAHWAILTGGVIESKVQLHNQKETSFVKGIPNLMRTPNSKRLYDILSFDSSKPKFDECTSSLHVYAKQGKSARNRLWSLHQLSLSNANLKERDPSKDWSKLHCPYNVAETLAKRFIVLHF